MRLASLAFAASALALSFAAAAPASAATTWDAVADFNPSVNTTSSVWQYGWDAGSGFTLFSNHGTCITGGLECWQSTDPQFFVPLIAKNASGSTLNYATTVVQPTNVLNLHPGGSVDGQTTGGTDIDTILRFQAPTAGSYFFKGFFEALDTNPTGVIIHAGADPVFINGNASASTLTTGAPTEFGFRIVLAKGEDVDFVVNRDTNYGNDSTGLSLTAAVPEPATWGLMIMGFGGIGAMLRSNRRRAPAATA